MAVKLTVNLPEETAQALKAIADARGTTVTEALRQIIESQRFLNDEMNEGKNVLIQNPSDKSIRQLIFNVPPKSSLK